jgi:hypothetical protein
MVVDNNHGRFRVWNAATNLESVVITGDGHVLVRNIIRGNQARSWSYCDFDGGNCTSASDIRNGVNVANNLSPRVAALEARVAALESAAPATPSCVLQIVAANPGSSAASCPAGYNLTGSDTTSSPCPGAGSGSGQCVRGTCARVVCS